MFNPIELAFDEIRQSILSAIGACISEGVFTGEPINSFVVEIPADTSYGDFATNVAMISAKTFKLPPRKIAEEICKRISLDTSYFSGTEIAGPGFINFKVNQKWFSNVVKQVISEGELYGQSTKGSGKKVMIEFVSANPTGPMHMGNARGGSLGDSLASIMQAAGYDVTREFYVNDAGNQILKFMNSLDVRYQQIYKGEDAVQFPEDGYKGEDIKERAKEFADIHGDKYINTSTEERQQAILDYALPLNISKMKNDLAKYRIEYDKWFLESDLHKSGAVDRAIELLTKNGYTYEKDGVLWYKSTAFGEEKDEVLIRSNGLPTYFAVDIAYHYNKFIERGFDKVINIWGADHHGHVARMKNAMTAIGINSESLDVVLMQLVRLVRDGQSVKMSKRTGKSITLSTLLDEVPIDAARFFFNMREPNSHFDFDLDLAVQSDSNNPVYYVQYAHARICSIIKNLSAEGIVQRDVNIDELNLLSSPEEIELIRHIAMLPNEIIAVSENYDSSKITRYCMEIAAKFHRFYNACRVKTDNEQLLQARLALCICVKTIIKNILTMLKVTAPETM